MKTLTRLMLLVLLAPFSGLGQGEGHGPCSCPFFNVVLTPKSGCKGQTIHVCAQIEGVVNGFCDNAPVGFSNFTYSWSVPAFAQIESATPYGSCIYIKLLSPGSGSISVAVIGHPSNSRCGDVHRSATTTLLSHDITLNLRHINNDNPKSYLGIDLYDQPDITRRQLRAIATFSPAASGDFTWNCSSNLEFFNPSNPSGEIAFVQADSPSAAFTSDWVRVSKLCASATGRVTVVKVDVTVPGLDEQHEEAPGHLMGVSTTGPGPLPDDDMDLLPVHITVEPVITGQNVHLTGHHNMYEDRRKTAATNRYLISELPSVLYFGADTPGEYWVSALHPQSGARDRVKITILKVESVEAYCDKFGASGSFGVNPEIFPGGEWDFGQPDQPPPYWWLPGTYANPSSQVLKVFFKYIKDANDEPAPFDIDLKANILPNDLSDEVLNITWYNWAGPSSSGAFDKTDEREVKFQNPTKGGLYKFRMEMELQPNHVMVSDAWVLLPEAGGEIADWIVTEVPSLVTRAADWETAVRAVAVANGLNEDEFLETAWIAIATYDFDYQGIVGPPTKRYSFRDADRPVGHLPDPSIPGMVGEKGNGDWDEPSYATLRGIVVHRAKVNNAMYAVWGRELGYTTAGLRAGAFWNAAGRGLWDDSTSQNAVTLGGDLYDTHTGGGSLSAVLTKTRAKAIQSPDTPTGLNDVNLWPDPTPVPSGFVLPTMPRDYDSLIVGTNETVRGRLFN